jgi:hypothetical protein
MPDDILQNQTAAIFGRFTWPGLISARSLTYTVSHGISPGVASIVAPEEAIRGISQRGDLVMWDGETKLTLTNCLVENVVRLGGETRVYQINVQDRRWRWQFAETVSGSFNERDWMNRPKPRTQLSPREIITYCLDTLGEADYEILGIDNNLSMDRWPQIRWENVNAAVALTEVCEGLGLRVIFQPWTDRVLISPLGVGENLPNKPGVMSYTPGLRIVTKPDKIQFVGGPRIFTVAIPLEAVGSEPEGTIKLIDDLSYRPTNGWGGIAKAGGNYSAVNVPTDPKEDGLRLIGIPGVTLGQMTRQEYQQLAKRCILKWYRIKATAPGDPNAPLKIPGVPWAITNRDDIVLLDSIYTPETIQDGSYRTDPPRIYGSFNRGEVDWRITTDKTFQIYDRTFSINAEKQIVEFELPIYRFTGQQQQLDKMSAVAQVAIFGIAAYQQIPADLVLVTSVMVRRPDNHAIWKYEFEKQIVSDEEVAGTGPFVLRHDEQQYIFYTAYSPGDWSVETTIDNSAEMEAAAEYYINAKAREYERVGSEEAQYAMLMDVDPDGKIHQITYSIQGGENGFTTTRISLGTEHSWSVPAFRERERTLKLKAIFDKPNRMLPEYIRSSSQPGGG